MRVFIDKGVHASIENFYDMVLSLHDALDEQTILKKVHRLYDAMMDLGDYAKIYPLARLKKDWINKEYREFICEDFHFAYQIYTLSNGEEIVRIHDACHSLFYHDQTMDGGTTTHKHNTK
jgi:hypothetical protein